MVEKVWLLLIAVASLSFEVSAQQVASQAMLSSEQREGRRIFQQKCAVCHVPMTDMTPSYAPILTKGLVEGDESAFREAITNGSGPRMPAWKYTLQPKQIDSIIAYLKTLDQPLRTVASERPER